MKRKQAQCAKSAECGREPNHRGVCNHNRRIDLMASAAKKAKPRLKPITETGVGRGLAATKRATTKLGKFTFAKLDNFLRTMTALYPCDQLAPGLVTACVPRGDNRAYYASIVRYENPAYDQHPNGAAALRAAQKQVLYKAESPLSSEHAIQCVIEQWMESFKGVTL